MFPSTNYLLSLPPNLLFFLRSPDVLPLLLPENPFLLLLLSFPLPPPMLSSFFFFFVYFLAGKGVLVTSWLESRIYEFLGNGYEPTVLPYSQRTRYATSLSF